MVNHKNRCSVVRVSYVSHFGWKHLLSDEKCNFYWELSCSNSLLKWMNSTDALPHLTLVAILPFISHESQCFFSLWANIVFPAHGNPAPRTRPLETFSGFFRKSVEGCGSEWMLFMLPKRRRLPPFHLTSRQTRLYFALPLSSHSTLPCWTPREKRIKKRERYFASRRTI